MNFLKQCLARLKTGAQYLQSTALPRAKACMQRLLQYCLARLKTTVQYLRKRPVVFVNIAALSLCAILAVVMLLTAKTPAPATEPTTEPPAVNAVGVCLAGPSGSALSSQITDALQQQGFQVNLLCADGNISTQKGQLQAQLTANVSCLILEPVDSLSLLELLSQAKQQQIPVIACDTMLMDTDWVWGYVGFDYRTLGKLMAKQVVQHKNLDAEDAKSCTIELFMGAPESYSSLLLYEGAMDIFNPYLRTGKLKVASGRTFFEDTCTAGTTAGAKEACVLRLQNSSVKPDILFAGTDDIAEGCRQALTAQGYKQENFPTIIGQGGSGANAVKKGTQLATYVKAPVLLAEACAEAAALALEGKALATDTTQNNRSINVPVKLLPTSLVDN